jgi:hypothetical protein
MNTLAAERLLKNLCAIPELTPEYWNIFEPIDIPLQQDKLQDVIGAMAPCASKAIRSLVFFVRRRAPRFLLTVDLCLAPFQRTTPHNRINFDESAVKEHTLLQYLPRCILPAYPDYASIPHWEEDKERYKEFNRSYSPREFVEMFTNKQTITAPFGPYGCLADVQWFNYFGRVYVDFIGRDRLIAADWERVEEVGDGLACFATNHIDDAHSRERRSRIAKVIEEFVWTPGCKPGDKRVPIFDFSEQLAALPANVAQRVNQSPTSFHVHFAGLTVEEQQEARRMLEQARASYDPELLKHRQLES